MLEAGSDSIDDLLRIQRVADAVLYGLKCRDFKDAPLLRLLQTHKFLSGAVQPDREPDDENRAYDKRTHKHQGSDVHTISMEEYGSGSKRRECLVLVKEEGKYSKQQSTAHHFLQICKR